MNFELEAEKISLEIFIAESFVVKKERLQRLKLIKPSAKASEEIKCQKVMEQKSWQKIFFQNKI